MGDFGGRTGYFTREERWLCQLLIDCFDQFDTERIGAPDSSELITEQVECLNCSRSAIRGDRRTRRRWRATRGILCVHDIAA